MPKLHNKRGGKKTRGRFGGKLRGGSNNSRSSVQSNLGTGGWGTKTNPTELNYYPIGGSRRRRGGNRRKSMKGGLGCGCGSMFGGRRRRGGNRRKSMKGGGGNRGPYWFQGLTNTWRGAIYGGQDVMNGYRGIEGSASLNPYPTENQPIDQRYLALGSSPGNPLQMRGAAANTVSTM